MMDRCGSSEGAGSRESVIGWTRWDGAERSGERSLGLGDDVERGGDEAEGLRGVEASDVELVLVEEGRLKQVS